MPNIEELAINFRNGIEKAIASKQFNHLSFFNRFPLGCCGDTSDLLAEYLISKSFKPIYTSGTYSDGSFENNYAHAWISVNGYIVDITADQFRDNPLFFQL